jgi:ABC-2 type transport system permease protein
MSGLKALTTAQTKGFFRDRQALFWILLFPLMFLLIFGSIFRDAGTSQSNLVLVGQVALVESLPAEAESAFNELFKVTRTDDRDAALEQVRTGDQDAALEMSGTDVVLHYTLADQVKAARIRGTIESFVNGANIAMSGRPPTFTLDARSVEDDSLKPIQYIAPGILGWAIAMGAVFGAGLPLVQWRQSKLLRRIRLSPTSTAALIGSRTVVTVAVALVQTVIFLGVGVLVFGLTLTNYWWMAIPLVIAAALAFMTVGLVVGAVSKSPEGASGLANLIIMPMAFLSGSFIPLDGAPPWMSGVAKILPLGHLNQGMLDVMVRGDGPAAVLQPLGVLLAFGVVFGLVAIRLFRWEA